MLSPTQITLTEVAQLTPMLLWTKNLTAWPDDSILVSRPLQTVNICLKRPSYYCLIHFYKRCVSALAWWVAHLRVRSGWVSVFVSHKPSLFRAKESSLNNDPNPYETKDMIESLSLYHFTGKLGCRSFQIFNNWISFNWLLRYFCNIKRRVSMSEVK